MADSGIIILALLFFGVRFLMRKASQTAKNARQKQVSRPQAKKAAQPAPSSQVFPEAAPVTLSLEEWRKQGNEKNSPRPDVQQSIWDIATTDFQSYEDPAKALSFKQPEVQKRAQPFSQARTRAMEKTKASPVDILPAFNRNSLVQAIVLKEILDRPPSARRFKG